MCPYIEYCTIYISLDGVCNIGNMHCDAKVNVVLEWLENLRRRWQSWEP